jgi:hypothetical protein
MNKLKKEYKNNILIYCVGDICFGKLTDLSSVGRASDCSVVSKSSECR